MRRLAKYLKPYWWLALLCVALVVTQAMSELKLPDYMSDIVNVAVMAYGIEDSVPEKTSLETYETLLAFMSAEDAALMGRYYAVHANIQTGQGYAEYRQPESLSRAQIKADRAQLDSAFARAFLVKSALDQLGAMTPEQQAALDMPAEMQAMLQASGQAITPFVLGLPQDVRASVIGAVTARFDAMGEMVATQVAAQALRAEYEAIGVDLSAIQRASILRTGGKMLAVALLVLAASAGATFLSSRVAAGFARDIRQKLFEKVTSFSSAEINQFSTASLITRTTNDVQQVQQMVTMMLRMLVFAPVMGLGGVFYAIQKSVSMSWIIALAVLVLMCVIALLLVFVTPKFKMLQKLVDRLNLVTRENVSGVMVSRAYNAQDFEAQRFDGANQALAKVNLFVQRAMVSLMPFIGLVMNALMLMIIWLGSHEIANSTLQIGDMMAYMQYAMHVVISFMFVSMMFIMLPRAAVSADRIAQVLDTVGTIHDPESPVKPGEAPDIRGLIEFCDVSFRYPGAEQNALENISFTARPGQMTAVIGATGSGKSSLMNLILRFYDVTGGQVRVAGQDVRNMTQHDLRGLLGYVPQKSVLFTGSIEENIRFGEPRLTDDAVRRVAATAQATGFIEAKEGGYQEHIAQGGQNVSGGQRQRLSIARALAGDAPILLFDDSFSALDFKTDAALRRALRQEAKNATLFIVAQRVGTIMNAEQIIVLDEGRIVGTGTHGQLMETCPTYQEIARSQLREEELSNG